MTEDYFNGIFTRLIQAVSLEDFIIDQRGWKHRIDGAYLLFQAPVDNYSCIVSTGCFYCLDMLKITESLKGILDRQ